LLKSKFWRKRYTDLGGPKRDYIEGQPSKVKDYAANLGIADIIDNKGTSEYAHKYYARMLLIKKLVSLI
jgi:hypothetical protein